MPENRVVGSLLRERARQHPDRLFLWCGPDKLTWAETDARSDRVAGGLAEAGVSPGDRVAFVCPNRMEFLELFFACAKLGAVQVPFNVFLKGEFLRYQMQDSQASTLIVDAAGLAAVQPLLNELPDLKRIICVDETDADVIPYSKIRSSEAPVPVVDLDASSMMSILYTSGTTGMPKGCMLSHGYYTHGAYAASEMMEYRPDDVLYTALPMFHMWARGMVIGALANSLPAVVDPLFSVGALPQRLAETGATCFAGVGMMGLAMLGTPPSAFDSQSRLRVALMIPFTPEQQEQFTSRFGGTVLAQLYGQTECGAITYSRLSDVRNLASIGKPAPYFDLRIVDDRDVEVPAGGIGEIVLRPKIAHAMFLGYWRKPSETLETWRNLWHHTGDYGRADDDGFITFVDRKKDALRRRGENVSSVELETAIIAHPKIAEAAVHAVPALSEDDIKACIVMAPGEMVTPEELFAYFKEALPYFAIPRYVEIVPELPRNATLRVMKHLLRTKGVTKETWDLEERGLTVAPTDRR